MTNSPRFDKVPTALDFPKEEAEILSFWKERRIFEKTLERTEGGEEFVFFEGPPTANGLPHNGQAAHAGALHGARRTRRGKRRLPLSALTHAERRPRERPRPGARRRSRLPLRQRSR